MEDGGDVQHYGSLVMKLGVCICREDGSEKMDCVCCMEEVNDM
jgi:hypothetical protein